MVTLPVDLHADGLIGVLEKDAVDQVDAPAHATKPGFQCFGSGLISSTDSDPRFKNLSLSDPGKKSDLTFIQRSNMKISLTNVI